MTEELKFTLSELSSFILRAQAATYAGEGGEVESQRPGFRELGYSEDKFEYRDSYAGFYRSRGMEVVRYEGQVVWCSGYGGGMKDGHDLLAAEAFAFLKEAMKAPEAGFVSFRGASNYRLGDWEYVYSQNGDVSEFDGYEEIKKNGEVVFYHHVIGGIVKNLESVS
jgi:hypothetical protein